MPKFRVSASAMMESPSFVLSYEEEDDGGTSNDSGEDPSLDLSENGDEYADSGDMDAWIQQNRSKHLRDD